MVDKDALSSLRGVTGEDRENRRGGLREGF